MIRVKVYSPLVSAITRVTIIKIRDNAYHVIHLIKELHSISRILHVKIAKMLFFRLTENQVTSIIQLCTK